MQEGENSVHPAACVKTEAEVDIVVGATTHLVINFMLTRAS